jgi:flagellar motor component MotA
MTRDEFITEYYKISAKTMQFSAIQRKQGLLALEDFIVCEGFNAPPFRAVKKVLNPETNTLPKQHTSPFRARLLIDPEKLSHRDIWEYGLRLIVDGTDALVINDILSPIIEQEKDKYTRLLMRLKLEAMLSIQSGDNPRILAYKLNAFTDITHKDDPVIQKYLEERDDNREIF